MSKTYSIEDKQRIADRIGKISNVKTLEKIRNIIMTENSDLHYSKTSAGIIFYFHNLKDITYLKLEQFFEKLESERILTHKTTSDTTDKMYDNINTLTETYETSTQYKLSNREKNIIKRKQYEKEIGGDEEFTEMYSDTYGTDQKTCDNDSDVGEKDIEIKDKKKKSVFVKKQTYDTHSNDLSENSMYLSSEAPTIVKPKQTKRVKTVAANSLKTEGIVKDTKVKKTPKQVKKAK